MTQKYIICSRILRNDSKFVFVEITSMNGLVLGMYEN